MAGSFPDRGSSAQSSRHKPLHRGPLIHHDPFHIKTIDVDGLLLGSVGNGRF